MAEKKVCSICKKPKKYLKELGRYQTVFCEPCLDDRRAHRGKKVNENGAQYIANLEENVRRNGGYE